MGYFMSNDIQTALRQEVFFGNESAFEGLTNYAKQGKLTAFTGSGVSAPLYPTWAGLLAQTLDDAIKDGFVTSEDEIREYREMLKSDPLELADFLEQVRSEHIFRTRLANTFRNSEGLATDTHELISKLNFLGIVTLNYDNGHETAYAKSTNRYANSGKAQDVATLTRWSQGDIFQDQNPPILHLHGDVSDPSQMILTSSDYDRFYAQTLPDAFISQLFRSHRLLIIGFGFADPFLTRLVERTLRHLPSDTRHYALIGRRNGETVSSVTRKSFAKKYRIEPVFYQVREGNSANGITQDHSDLLILLQSLQGANAATSARTSTKRDLPSDLDVVRLADKEFKADLFVAPNGVSLYAEPRFASSAAADAEEPEEFTVESIVADAASYLITCRPEFGATTVARRLVAEFVKLGQKALLRDASQLPNYKKKLLDHFETAGVSEQDTCRVLVLDNFDVVVNERLLKELIGTKLFPRIIVLAKQTLFEATVSSVPTDQFSVPYKSASIQNFRRTGFRS
jgi:hypothetical protein